MLVWASGLLCKGGLGFRVYKGLRFIRVKGLGFRVQGFIWGPEALNPIKTYTSDPKL